MSDSQQVERISPAIARCLSALVFCVSLVISLGVAELVMRQVFVTPGNSFEHRIPHPVFGWSLEPNAVYNNEVPESTVLVRYNSQGYRDVEWSREKSASDSRILILGDSFMEAYSVNYEDSLAYQLEETLQNAGRGIEVLNMGVGGYGTLQEYLVWENLGRDYDPDLVLLGFYVGNDLADNSRKLQSYIYTNNIKLAGRPFLDANVPAEWKITRVDYEGAVDRYKRAVADRSWLRHESVLFMTLKQALADDSSAAEAPESVGGPTNYEPLKHLALRAGAYCRTSPEVDEAWTLTRRILERLRDSIENAGAKLIVFSVPAIYEVDALSAQQEIAASPVPGALCIEDAPGHARLASTLADLDIPFIDLLAIFRERADAEGESLFWKSDEHWNANGHRTAAEAIAASLSAQGLLNHSAATRSAQ